MIHTIVISPAARDDLDRIYDFIAARASDETALRFSESIVDRIQQLADFPHQGTRRQDVMPDLRTLGFRRRVTIAFRVRRQTVEVLGVFYGGRDYRAVLAGN